LRYRHPHFRYNYEDVGPRNIILPPLTHPRSLCYHYSNNQLMKHISNLIRLQQFHRKFKNNDNHSDIWITFLVTVFTWILLYRWSRKKRHFGRSNFLNEASMFPMPMIALSLSPKNFVQNPENEK
jgi:hypothetical protein